MRPTKPQMRALTLLHAREQVGANAMQLSHLMHGVAAAANIGKVEAMLARCRHQGWVKGTYGNGWRITDAGSRLVLRDSAPAVIDLMGRLQDSLARTTRSGQRLHSNSQGPSDG